GADLAVAEHVGLRSSLKMIDRPAARRQGRGGRESAPGAAENCPIQPGWGRRPAVRTATIPCMATPALDPKAVAGRAAADLVPDGSIVGLGTGSTVHFTLLRLAERMR